MNSSQVSGMLRRPRPVSPAPKGLDADPRLSRKDYRPPDPLERYTLQQRAKNQTARNLAMQEYRNRDVLPKLLPPARNNSNSIFRRYEDGTLDTGYALGLIAPAAKKYQDGIPLTEHDALIISSVFGVLFSNLPVEVVKVKAFLTPSEASLLCRRHIQGRQSGALSVLAGR